jgi:hypothetical protein
VWLIVDVSPSLEWLHRADVCSVSDVSEVHVASVLTSTLKMGGSIYRVRHKSINRKC